MFGDDIAVVTIVGEGTATGVEGTVNIGLNGGTPAASIQIPPGKTLALTDELISSATNPVEVIVQQSQDNGANWFNVMLERTVGQDSNGVNYVSARVIKGGPQTFMRVRQLGGAGAMSISLSGWMEDSTPGKGLLSVDFGLPNMTGRVTTAGSGEQTLPIGVDFSAPVSAVQVPAGVSLEITDWVVCASAGSIFRIQQSDDGGLTWYNRAVGRVVGGGPSKYIKFQTPITIVGSATAQMRLRVTTPLGAADVDVTLGLLKSPAGGVLGLIP